MTHPNSTEQRQARDDLLDALLDAMEERRTARASSTPATPIAASPPPRASSSSPPAKIARKQPPGPGEPGWAARPELPSIGLERALGRMLLLVLALTILLNVPINRYGVSLARILPDSAALVIRDGLIIKGSGPEIYRLEDNTLRWITSMAAFEHLGLAWKDVHVVEDAFLARFERGVPIHVLLKCPDSPHIYRLEGEYKRWIKDIPTFEAEGHVWEDIRTIPCHELRAMADGLPIPIDAGTPPQPLP